MKSVEQHGFIKKLVLVVLFFVATGYFFYTSFFIAPKEFPIPYHLTIEPGQTLFSVSSELLRDSVIRSPRVFEMFMLSLGNEKNISEGEYYFSEPLTALGVAMRISGKQFGIDRQRITFPEGFTNKNMADRLVQVFPNFNASLFLELTKDDEGYLFPDTYGFFPSLAPDFVVTTLKRNFDKKIATVADQITSSSRTKADIITMASIIEKEANGKDDRAVISGILWKRLDRGMLLQVDAPFLFLFDKQSSELTLKDLATDSPYNTYKYKGLPPGPISNPGLESIKAALNPEVSPYLYYLHDKTGAIHYASTYKEHLANITRYLK
ncbi:endolytic transglycosylase MltG [Patescibacteria group bacterium]|nr:endolytic transglycosylase MltG [Patescibacteria group bacterium]